ncbi:MAG: hypothetical protein K2J03_05990, partial [Muribaculaceae bacterium]|nr:hypothetical protein [Muribaculaceae bacterium]
MKQQNNNMEGRGGRIRRIILTLGLLIAALIPGQIAAQDIFSELTNDPSVKSTYVSGKFSHNSNGRWYSRSYEHSMQIGKDFSTLFQYECNGEETVKTAERILSRYLKENPDMELMRSTNNYGSIYSIYEKFNGDGKVIQLIIMNKETPQFCEIVVVNWKNGYQRSENSKLKISTDGI